MNRVLSGLILLLGLGFLAWRITQAVYAAELPLGIPGKVLEYPLWAALVGLIGNLILRLVRLHDWVHPGIRTELCLKTGLVLLGAGVNLSLLAPTAGASVAQSLIMISSVFFFSWWLGGRLGLDDKLRAVMSTALAVCGVSAAIAAAGSVLAKKEQVTYVTTLVILVALPLMVLAPLAAEGLGLTQPVAGAWFGGNIDTTAAVVGAGTIFGDEAQKVASIVKSTQNALIGIVAFLLAVYFAGRQEAGIVQRPNLRLVWDRFPKFVLGFVLASILYSLGWIDGGKGTVIEALKNWAFTFAFVGIGLEFSLGEFRSMGWKPLAVFLVATLFNTVLALGAAWALFGRM
jgi:uncharacterized membrane protein YadS